MDPKTNGLGKNGEAGSCEPIAIIGMACRFSGNAVSPGELWNMLSEGHSGWSSDTGNRFNIGAFWHPKADISGSVSNSSLTKLA
jgi:emericellamide synthase (highly reducing iterative type I polyketide synthase)